jgi:hypothetical protein
MAYSWKSAGRQLKALKLHFSERAEHSSVEGENRPANISLSSFSCTYSISTVLKPGNSRDSGNCPKPESFGGQRWGSKRE